MPETLFIDQKVDNNTVSVQKHLLFRNFSDPDHIDIINPKSFQVIALLMTNIFLSFKNIFFCQLYSGQANENDKEKFLKDLFPFFKVNKRATVALC